MSRYYHDSSDGTFGALLFIGLMVLLIVNYFFASRMRDVAINKGYDDNVHAFAWVFWFGIFGVLYVISLPDLVERNKMDSILKCLKNDPEEAKKDDYQDIVDHLPKL